MLQERKRGDGTRDAVKTDLLEMGADALLAEGDEERVYGAELGRNLVRAKIKYNGDVHQVEDRINYASFRGKDWSVEGKDRDHQYMTLTLERA